MERICYKGYFIDKTKNGYRISKATDTSVHTHLKNLNPSYKLIDNVVNKVVPRRCGVYYLESHARISDDKNYICKIKDYIEVKQTKTHQNYFNPHKKKF